MSVEKKILNEIERYKSISKYITEQEETINKLIPKIEAKRINDKSPLFL